MKISKVCGHEILTDEQSITVDGFIWKPYMALTVAVHVHFDVLCEHLRAVVSNQWVRVWHKIAISISL